jgi:hypothetical protein
MDFGKIIARARAILTTPKTEWPVVAAEPATVQGLYVNYILVVAALPAIAGFIKNSLIGFSLLGVTVRTPVGSGLAGMVLQYLLSLVLVYVMALIVNALAPTFEGQKDQVQAVKAIAYAWTASWAAGIAVILPWIGVLVAIAGGVYAIYLLYLGLPATMKCPPEKTAGYTAVTVVIGIVLSWIIGMVVAGVIGTAALTGAAVSGSRVTLGSADGSVTVDPNSAVGKLAAMGDRAEQASKELEAAQKSGAVQSLPADQIKGFLPDKVGSFKRESLSAERSGAGVQVTVAHGEYVDGHRRIDLEVSDTGSMKGMMAMATSFAPEAERQTDTGYEKTYSENGRLVHESWDKTSKSGEYGVIVGQRFSVKASGNTGDIDALKDAVKSVDLDKLEALKNDGVAGN